MRKKRRIETTDERDKRLNQAAQSKSDDRAAADDAVDAMVKRSIDRHGP